MLTAPAVEVAALDPRVRRTRQMLYEALERLLAARSLEKISVGDIAEEATLNRATVYDHFPDKYALLQGLVAARFDELLTRRAVVYDGTCPSAMMQIALALCDYLASQPGIACPRRMEPMEAHFERALGQVVRGIMLAGVRRHGAPKGQSPEMVASAVAGAIYGSVREWAGAEERVPAEEAVRAIFGLVGPMLEAGGGEEQIPVR